MENELLALKPGKDGAMRKEVREATAELAQLGEDWNHAKIGCEDCEAQARAAKGRK